MPGVRLHDSLLRMIEEQPGTDWRDLQLRVAAILGECGLVCEVSKSLQVARGTVEIDVYATDPTTTPPAIYLCECKRWSTPVPQGEVQTFRTVVGDAGLTLGFSSRRRAFRPARSKSRNTLMSIS